MAIIMVTPHEKQDKLAEAIGIPLLYFKREDLHPYGSHKGRSIPVMIDRYYSAGNRKFTISSSGNAALAAALYIKELNAKNGKPAELDIFVGTNIDKDKLERVKALVDEHIRVLIKERPRQAVLEAEKEGARSLRQSTDDIALEGYRSLAEELATIKDIGAVFIGTSSGTTAQALAQYFISKKLPVQVHIVQTSSCHPLSDAFGAYDGPDEASIAGAIVDLIGQRKMALIPLIETTGGRGWVATNEAITAAQELVSKNCAEDISTNSALSVAGVMQAVYTGYEMKGAIVCMICGE